MKTDSAISLASSRVPIYSIASLVSLYSLDLAFFVDAVRDIYEVSASLGSQSRFETLADFVLAVFHRLSLSSKHSTKRILIICSS